MILRFPQLEILSLAITSGLIAPEDVVRSAAARVEKGGAVWVQSALKLSKDAKNQLGEWGVTSHRSKRKAGGNLQAFASLLQIFPLRKDRAFKQPIEKTPVLFELNDEAALPEIVNEILRQGNDRQSFRSVADRHGERVLLRVLGPPYYTLLRALDQTSTQGSTGDPPRAFIEQAPRVWVQAGYQHPFAKQIKPKAGQQLLLGQPTQWRALKEQPYRDIYEHLDFQLPAMTEPLQDDERDVRLSVPVRLVRGGADDAAELFVLKRDATRQLDDFVASASDETLRRLSFVRSDTKDGGQPVVIIRIRPGRGAPPVLVFEGLACRQYLRIPNLFVPVGQRIHPPLRRDAVKEMLAADNSTIVWLEPDNDGGSMAQQFVPRSTTDSAFRPLSDWVDHTIERDAEVMTAWIASHTFDFEEFVCPDEETKRRKKKKPAKNSRSSAGPDRSTDATTLPTAKKTRSKKKSVRKFRKPKADATDLEQAELKAQLQALELEFTALDAPLDDPLRESMWGQMAGVNADLRRFADASICRQHELWEQPEPNADTALAWFHTEVAAARFVRSRSLGDDDAVVTDRHLKAWLARETPSPAEVAQLAGFVTTAIPQDGEREIVRSQQAGVQNYLERHEAVIGVRASWLAWFSLASVSGDVLMLARARDRLLRRLFEQGLVPDRDLPSFLRISGTQASDRFRIVRDRVSALHGTAREWSHRNLSLASRHTLSYVDLMFAYGFARLGESTRATELLREAGDLLPHRSDPVHGWLLAAFGHRIKEPSDHGPLPEELLHRLETVERLDRYKVDRLREHSAILEPHEQLDPYRRWRRQNENELQHELSALFDVVDRTELLGRLRKIFDRKLSADEKARLVTTALELSPRLGEKFAGKMLGHVEPSVKKSQDVLMRAAILEKGIHVAGHYDLADVSRTLLDQMKQLIVGQQQADVKVLAALESLLSQSFQTMRKLGMRDETATLLELLSDRIRPADPKKAEPERLGVLLQVAGAWFYFGEDRGWKDIDTVRSLLLRGTLRKEGHVGIKKQVDLACSYIRAVGQAPIDDAIARFNELFEVLDGIHDSATVNTHYSLKQLDIVDALIGSIASESFAMNKESQRWLDDEEFLIRRRVHREVREMMGH